MLVGHFLKGLFCTISVSMLSAVSAQQLVDTIYTGGLILTMDDANPRAEVVAVKDGVIVAVGTLRKVAPYRGPDTKTFDLAGQNMLPGFVDSHGHVVMAGL